MSERQALFFLSKEDILHYFEGEAYGQQLIEELHPKYRQLLFDYMLGKKTLPLTYDPFFKKIFNLDQHQERISGFLSSILGRKVEAVTELHSEHTLFDGYTVVILDILVKLDDGSYADVEIQKFAEGFPDQRISCYSADLLMREYNAMRRAKGKHFSYRDIKTVYSIILYETSKMAYHDPELQGAYFHHGKITFDTGLKLELPQEFYVIALDVFRENGYTKDITPLNGWLSLLTTENMADVDMVIEKYPWLKEIYEEMTEYMQDPKEVLSMFSEALQELDRRSMKMFVDELVAKEKELSTRCDELEVKEKDLTTRCDELTNKNDELTNKNDELTNKNDELTNKNDELTNKNDELTNKNDELTNKNDELTNKNDELSNQNDKLLSENCELEKQIAELQAQIEQLRCKE